MAKDPITGQEIPDAQTIDASTTAANKASEALGNLNTIGTITRNVFSEFETRLQSVGISLKTNARMTQEQAQAFGLLSAEVVGARKAFEGLANVDSSGLDTFKKQWSDLGSMIDGSPLGSKMKGMLGGALKQLGADSGQVDKAAAKGKEALMTFGAAFLTSADNGLKLQNAMVQLASKTGNLNNLFEAAGPSLGKINFLLANQQKAITDASGATKLGAEVVEKYYAQLGAVPRALESTVMGANTAGKSVSMLTATIQYATGSGRKYEEVVDDLKFAFTDLNVHGEPALKFTARMGELSNKFGIELSDVRSSLRETASMFKMFGSEAEGAAKMMNSYLGELQKTGISGKTALEVMNGMTQGIKGMSLAQKGFLSGQTGGAGGLMGAFQIEKMLRDGKIDEVFEKVRQQMSKQMGNIVTLDDAQNSPQAAAQLTKQMLMLQQGPLGKFAKDDQSAMRILEAFKSRESGGSVKGLSDSVVQDTMKSGVDLQEKSVTELTRIRELIQGNQGLANIANLGTMQHAMTAGVGTPMTGPTADFNRGMRRRLRETSSQSAIRSGVSTDQMAQDYATGTVKNRLGAFSANMVTDYSKFIDEVGPAIKAPLLKIKELLKSGKTDEAHKMFQNELMNSEKQRAQLSNAPESARLSGMQNLSQNDAILKSTYGMLAATDGKFGDKSPKALDMNMNLLGNGGVGDKLPKGLDMNMNLLGNNPADVINRTANRVSGVNGASAGSTSNQGPQPISGEIKVHVEGFCLACGDKVRKENQSNVMSVGSTIPK